MTLNEVQERVEYIRAIAADDEAAHAAEDALHMAVLQAIADGSCTAPRSCAETALETVNIDFERWCA